jgi:hypothetical protein
MKEDIESILIINKYLTLCKMNDPNSDKYLTIRNFLNKHMDRALKRRSRSNLVSSIPFFLYFFR